MFFSPVFLKCGTNCNPQHTLPTVHTARIHRSSQQWRVDTVGTAHDARSHGRRRQARIRVPVHRTCPTQCSCEKTSGSWLLNAQTLNNYSYAYVPASSISPWAWEGVLWGCTVLRTVRRTGCKRLPSTCMSMYFLKGSHCMHQKWRQRTQLTADPVMSTETARRVRVCTGCACCTAEM